MYRRTAVALLAAAACLGFASAAHAQGAPGVGDPYFPLEGNGGYDAIHYDVKLSYDPDTDRLDGVVTMAAKAEKDLSRFDMDLQQLDVSGVTVNGRSARFVRAGQELKITPRHKLHRRRPFVTQVRYGGVPETIVGSPIVFGSPYGFLHTEDGNFVGAEPNAASTWFPSNDHPSDKATYVWRITVPKGVTAVANGRLVSSRTRHGESTFVWYEDSPMATYLTTIDTGQWEIRPGRTPGGVPEYVAADPVLPDVNGVAPVDFFYDTSAEAVDFLSRYFGRYPFSSTGAIADNATYQGTPLGFSLETQTKPVYSAVRDTSDDRARAGAPVVRRQRDALDVGQHLAQRGLRDVRRVPVARARRHAVGARVVPEPTMPARPRRRSGRSSSRTRNATRCSPVPSTAAAA